MKGSAWTKVASAASVAGQARLSLVEVANPMARDQDSFT